MYHIVDTGEKNFATLINAMKRYATMSVADNVGKTSEILMDTSGLETTPSNNYSRSGKADVTMQQNNSIVGF